MGALTRSRCFIHSHSASRIAASARIERLEGRTLLAGNPGDPDPAFGGGDGLVIENDSGFARSGIDVAAVAGGKLVAIEIERGQPVGNQPGSSTTRVVRYNPDGTRDASFASGEGTVVNGARTLAVRGDGKVLVGVPGGGGAGAVVRLNADGSLDNSFGGGDGRADLGGDIGVGHVAAAPADKVVGSFNRPGEPALEVFRLNADGSPDTSFSG